MTNGASVFTIVLERNENQGYTVTVPALRGCVTEGASLADALVNAREAIECHLRSPGIARPSHSQGLEPLEDFREYMQ